jgi:hypothetical protein
VSNFSVAGRAVLFTIQERKITVVDDSIEAVVASNEKKKKEAGDELKRTCTSTK